MSLKHLRLEAACLNYAGVVLRDDLHILHAADLLLRSIGAHK